MRSSLTAIHPADQKFEISSSLNLIVVGACRERPNKKAVEIMKARGVPRSILDDSTSAMPVIKLRIGGLLTHSRNQMKGKLGESFGVWDTANQKWTGTSIGIYELTEGIIAAVGGTSYSTERRTATSPCHRCPIISPRSNGTRHSFPVEFTSHP
ncbi:hypothetical protein BDZ89DRAFT_1081875 [Hymenopellis radicata]|nr:hypothetical protein BDZ89DRAFT_1081875 [Hymenopellis radicata]